MIFYILLKANQNISLHSPVYESVYIKGSMMIVTIRPNSFV